MESFCNEFLDLQPPASSKKSRILPWVFFDKLRMVAFDFYVGAENIIPFRRRDFS